jgi:hypothetical protein
MDSTHRRMIREESPQKEGLEKGAIRGLDGQEGQRSPGSKI